MAKSKKPSKDEEPKKPKKPAKKPAKPAKGKPKPGKSAVKATGKGSKGSTTKKSAKPAGAKKTTKAKKSGKPTKPKTVPVAFLAATPITVGGAIATPHITKPPANSNVPAGVDLKVEMTTDQVGFRYILTLTDVTPPPPPPPPPALPPPIMIPVPVNFNIAAPGASPFSSTIPGANFVAGHSYRLRLWVDPGNGATPPNNDHTIPLTS